MPLASFDTTRLKVTGKPIDIKAHLMGIARTASLIEVCDEVSFNRISSLYAHSKSWEKKIEAIRKEANAPEQAIVNARNDRAKELMIPLKQIQTIAKQKCDCYVKLLEKKKEDERQEMLETSDLLGFEALPTLPEENKSVRGDGAFVYTRTVRKFRTIDLSKVPLRYLQLDERAVEQDIKLGVGEIAGLEIYEESVTQLRTR